MILYQQVEISNYCIVSPSRYGDVRLIGIYSTIRTFVHYLCDIGTITYLYLGLKFSKRISPKPYHIFIVIIEEEIIIYSHYVCTYYIPYTEIKQSFTDYKLIIRCRLTSSPRQIHVLLTANYFNRTIIPIRIIVS